MHGLNIEYGGSRMEAFTYAWCPCGWTQEERPGDFAEDRLKRGFLAHLRSVEK